MKPLHPSIPVKTVVLSPPGYKRLKVGERVRKDDLYPSKGGTWERAGMLAMPRNVKMRKGDMWVRKLPAPAVVRFGGVSSSDAYHEASRR